MARTRRPTMLVSVAAIAALSAVPGTQAAQQPAQPPVFRSSTRLIVQTVTVKDREGRPIEGLTAPDFVVTEDGERQEVAFVEYQRLDSPGPATSGAGAPASLGTSDPLRRGNLSAPLSAARTASGPRRLLVLYFDFTAMPPLDLTRAFSAAQKFVASRMDGSHLVAIMAYDGGAVRVKTDFTDDRARLEEALLRLIFGDDLDGDGVPDNPADLGTAFGQDDAEFNILNTDRQLSALQTAATMLRPFPEQKSLVYFASGLRLNGSDNQAQLRATTNAAIRANVSIYPVDARGLVASAPLGDATRGSPGGLGMFSGRLADSAIGSFQRSQDTLYALAKDTGGEAMFDANDLSDAIVRAAQAVGSYYIIGFYSTHMALDGKFRRVRVSLAAGTAGELTYREGYYADKAFAKFSTADKERQLEEALMLENPITELTIAMEVNYFQLNRAEYFVPVAVKIPGSELVLARRGGAHRTVIDFIGEVKDDYGITLQNVRDKLDIRLTDETASQLTSRPIQYETGFTLLPGKYVIKILARDAETGRIGTYQSTFTIPNLNRETTRVPISSVVLSSQRVPIGEALYSVKQRASDLANPLVAGGQKLVPSVTRVFSRRRELFVFLQAYQRDATEIRPLVGFVSFFRGGQKVFETLPLAISDALDPQSKAVPLRFRISLADIAPGAYECQVSVLDSQGVRATFWRGPIVVVP